MNVAPRIAHWILMVSDGIGWYYMAFNCIQLYLMVFNGIAWYSVKMGTFGIFRCPKMGLRAPESKNGDHFYKPNIPPK